MDVDEQNPTSSPQTVAHWPACPVTDPKERPGDQFYEEITLPHWNHESYPHTGVTVHVSNTFGLSFKADNVPPNIIILSLDSTFFLAHCHKLLTSSNNNFGCLISPTYGAVCNNVDVDALELCLPESASVLNLLLCTVYGFTCEQYLPPFESLLDALEALKKYGFSLPRYLLPGLPLYNAFLDHVPLHPLETYAIAAENDLEDLAVVSSSYTLDSTVHSIPDGPIPRIGFIYFQRLYKLHDTRMKTLRGLFNVELLPHTAKPYCSPWNRHVTSKAFLFAGMQIYYNATPGMPGLDIVRTMADLSSALSCPDCKQSVDTRTAQIVRDWVSLKRTV
ncbi:hypothetical protein BDY19DRAFT_294417 [Irpex rosettiformis]|uniref:Uncharacterized protein n=1 Tax=Irpex rosettiformis TaxID=378272 RepID=A0ACB8UI94_9APHY|nr:hypothetical protein BDY19DRAFT_294417 [Irpex rosettiformis]